MNTRELQGIIRKSYKIGQNKSVLLVQGLEPDLSQYDYTIDKLVKKSVSKNGVKCHFYKNGGGYISVNGENILTTSNNETLYNYFVKYAWC